MKVRTFTFAELIRQLKEPISITAISSISSIGSSLKQTWEAYQKNSHYLENIKIGNDEVYAATLPESLVSEIEILRNSDSKYKYLDLSVLYAMYTSRFAIETSGWTTGDNFGVNIGSSRGATSLFERYHKEFLKSNNTSTLTSPTTTLGNISTWVAHDLGTKGPNISHSITCSTALHAMLNGIAWIQSGMADKFLVGGSEAPLTAFTIAQMKALKIYTSTSPSSFSTTNKTVSVENFFPCRALDLEKTKNTMVLGEGASVACLEKGSSSNTIAKIIGLGYATEALEHNVSISKDAQCFQDSMTMALGGQSADNVDVVVMHSPGTVKGDKAEYNAVKKVFCNKTPFLTTNKWKVGHTFGASGMLSIEMAILMLLHQKTIPVPFVPIQDKPSTISRVMVNAVGFGGNAVSILLSK
ncbi:beta-ketoacyl synthase N-terminal-like domain-containing protein [Croceitalea sp. P059]|uniref:beta-ketoacyl synthase N-terminal-like domain-containing protein n=1 Tax=Croceitalea sp. P059 TaxID=3075601 RepID=UPI00288580D0|nr:beta-ketoacyl synthase N-terminal-like domain-containing protein [Croceitalea sp. P059]MDT0538433.1 beta-ketoacyl synthase N-terminal-like domain-containing protein [Croceitalea sp. P059]